MHQKRVPTYRIPSKQRTLPFQSVAMDLITGLPERREHDAILTIVDQGCSCAAIFLPCHTTITRPGVVQLYFDNVVQWFGLPSKIISDRDPRFTSQFRKVLATKLGITQNLSTAFHPQTDSLLERKNQWVEQYLQLVMSAAPEDWDQWLTTASVVHNNQKNQTTGLSPNQVLIGYDVPLNTPNDVEMNNMTVEWQIRIMNQRRDQAIKALNHIAEQKGIPLAQYKTRDQVWLEGKNLKLPYQVTKLTPKQFGPFKIIKEISPVAYQLQLLLTWTIHEVFHASLLSPYSETPTHGPNFSQPPPDLIGGEEEYKVESIKAHRHFGRNKRLQFLIWWKGYPESDNTWEPADSIHALDLVKEYKQRMPSFHINSSPNNSSHSITLVPLWPPHPIHTGSLEPYPNCPRHLVPSSFTSSSQSTCQANLLPCGPTLSLALHYSPIPPLCSRALHSSHSHTHPQTHLVLSGGQAWNSLPISQSHTQLRLRCLTPPLPLPATPCLTTSPHPRPHPPTLSHSAPLMPISPCSCQPCRSSLSPPLPLPMSSTVSTSMTQSDSGASPSHSSKPLGIGTGSTTKSRTSMQPRLLTSIRNWPSSKKRPGSMCHPVTKKTTASPCSLLTRVMAYTNPPSGSNCWTTTQCLPSLRAMAREVPLTFTTSMPNPRLEASQ